MLVSLNVFRPPVDFLLTVSKRCFYCRSFLLFMFPVCLCDTVLSVLACWEKSDILALLCVMFPCTLSLSNMVPGSGVILDCIDP